MGKTNINSQRFTQLDVIRFVAFALLLTCHASDPFMAAMTYGKSGVTFSADLATWAARWGSFVRPCVPLFVMLTGALLLPVKEEMGKFYKKRITRVLWPFLIWSSLYYLTPWITGLMGLDKHVIYDLFAWAESDSQSLQSAIDLIVRIPYHFSFLACHMWYIYLLIGLYLYMPIFSAWVEKATKRQKEWLLGIWFLSTFLPYITEYVSRYSFGSCEWNAFGLFYYFAGFNGYLLLGHYLHTYINWRAMKSLIIGLPILIVGFIITLFGYQYILSLESPTPEQIELFWTYCTPNVAMMSFSMFLILKCIKPSTESRVGKILCNLTKCGFGIYMVHYFFIHVGFVASNALNTPSALRIPFAALVSFAVTWAIVAFAKKIFGKKLNFLLG